MDLSFNLDIPEEPLVVMGSRELTEADHAMLEAGPKYNQLKRLTDRHHTAARLVAAGKAQKEVAHIVGYHPQNLFILMQDPSFVELVEYYRGEVNDQYRSMHAQLAGLGADAIDELRARLEQEPDKFGAQFLLDVIKTAADRTGAGPASSVKQEVNVTIGLADRMAQARKAAQLAVEGTARDITPPKGDA